MESDYNNLDFCINIINDYIDSKDKNKYRVEPIIISELDIDNILKKDNFNYDNIFNNLNFYKNINDKYIYFAKNYEVNISKFSGNKNLLSTKENVGLLFNYVLSELVTINNLDIILLNIMNFCVPKKDIKNKINNLDNFNDEDLLLISIYERRTQNVILSDFLKENKINLIDMKIIFFKILYILDKISSKYKNFRHNNLSLDSIRISENINPNKINIKIGNENYEFLDKFLIKITNFENSYSDSIYKKTLKNISKENPFYDIHYFFSSFINYCNNNNITIDDKINNFIKSIIPEKYRTFENKNYKLDEDYYLSNETNFIIPKDLLKNIFFSDIINNNIEKNMNISASPISISESSLSNYKKKENNINYDINSLTESSYDNSRMFAKNIKYKNKKTSSHSNNIKDTMIKGTRRLYVPTRKNILEGNMSSDILTAVEKDERTKKERRGERREKERENDNERREEDIEEEVEDESSIESTENKMARSKKSKKTKSKKSKSLSESSLTSLSSDIINNHSAKNSVKLNSAQAPNAMLEGLMPQQNIQAPAMNSGVNNIGKLLGHGPSVQQAPPNLPMTEYSVPGMEGSMASAPMPMPQMQNLPAMPGMPQMEMPQMGMQQMGMPQMSPSIQSVNLNEGAMNGVPNAVPQQNGLTFDKLMTQQGGKRNISYVNNGQKVNLKLKKDFFF